MYWLIPIISVLAFFGVPAYFFKRYFDLKERRLKLDSDTEQLLKKELGSLRDEGDKMRERLQVLESIVVEGDFELNKKLNALEDDKQKALPEPKKPGQQ